MVVNTFAGVNGDNRVGMEELIYILEEADLRHRVRRATHHSERMRSWWATFRFEKNNFNQYDLTYFFDKRVTLFR